MTEWDPHVFQEWSYAHDDLDIVYCLGRSVSATQHEVVAAYYKTDAEHATKQTLDARAYYRRCIYQGLPEERERLLQVERPDVVERLLAHTAISGVGIAVDSSALRFSDARYRELKTWLESGHLKSHRLQQALHVACNALARADVVLDELSLYGGASFGVVNKTDKIVDDIDIVFKADNLSQLRAAIEVHDSPFTWSEIDPFGRLPKERQLLKARRWASSQIRLLKPYPLSIDFKVARLPDQQSLWDSMPAELESQPFSGVVKVVDDTEGLCISPAFRCEDETGNERIVLMDGYQYIGCAVTGDVISLRGTAYRGTNVIRITQTALDGVTPDFRSVPIE